MTGKYLHKIDAKNRLAIPAKLREELLRESDAYIGAVSEGRKPVKSEDIAALDWSFVLVKLPFSKTLTVYSESGWEKYVEPIRSRPKSETASLMRYLADHLENASVDGQGRIILSQNMQKAAGICGGEAVIVGCMDYAEIWSPELYEAEIGGMSDADALAEMKKYGM